MGAFLVVNRKGGEEEKPKIVGVKRGSQIEKKGELK